MHAEESASKYHTIVKPIYQYTLHRHIRVRPAYINSPAAKGGGVTPKSLIYFFSLLIIHPWGVYNEIWGGVEVSPLSNFKYSRWRPRWFPRRKFLLFRCFSASHQPCFGQYACFGFNGWSRNGLRRIVSIVAMVTGNIDNI